MELSIYDLPSEGTFGAKNIGLTEFEGTLTYKTIGLTKFGGTFGAIVAYPKLKNKFSIGKKGFHFVT